MENKTYYDVIEDIEFENSIFKKLNTNNEPTAQSTTKKGKYDLIYCLAIFFMTTFAIVLFAPALTALFIFMSKAIGAHP